MTELIIKTNTAERRIGSQSDTTEIMLSPCRLFKNNSFSELADNKINQVYVNTNK
jgi:hypothetical protein